MADLANLILPRVNDAEKGLLKCLKWMPPCLLSAVVTLTYVSYSYQPKLSCQGAFRLRRLATVFLALECVGVKSKFRIEGKLRFP